MTDLERDIAQALHDRAEHITVDDLRAQLRTRPARRPLAVVAVVACAAVVIALAVGLAILHSTGSTPSPASGGSEGPGAAVGLAWRLETVQDRHGRTYAPVDPTRAPWLAFARDGSVYGDDGVNSQTGRYTVTATGFSITDVLSTAVGVEVGGDPAFVATLDGFDAVMSARHVDATVTPGHLVITVGGYTLHFVADGPFRFRDPAASSTPAASDTAPGGSPPSYVNGSELAPSPTTTP